MDALCIFAPQVCSADDRNVKWRKELAQRLGCIARYCKAVSLASEFLKFHLQTHMDSNHLDLVDPDFLFVLDLFWLKKPHLQFVFGISLKFFKSHPAQGSTAIFLEMSPTVLLGFRSIEELPLPFHREANTSHLEVFRSLRISP